MTPRNPSVDPVTVRRFGEPRAAPWPGWASSLAQVPLFSDLSRRHVKKVAGLAELRWYSDGRTLARAGASGDAFFAILEGRAKVLTPSGHTRVLEGNESFGELSLIDGAPRAATVVSSGGVSVARIQRPAFLKLLREEPAIAVGLAHGLVATIRDLQRAAGGPMAAVGGDFGRSGDVGQSLEELAEASNDRAAEKKAARIAAPLLASVPLFSELPKRHLRGVARIAELKRYPSRSVVIRAGARGAVFHVIVEGRAQAVTPNGHTRTMEWGDSFGELSLLDGAPRAATVTAAGELATLRIGRPAFLKLVNEEPTIAVGLVKGLVALVRDLQREEAG